MVHKSPEHTARNGVRNMSQNIYVFCNEKIFHISYFSTDKKHYCDGCTTTVWTEAPPSEHNTTDIQNSKEQQDKVNTAVRRQS